MSQTRHADWMACNDKIRKVSLDAFATYDESHDPARRWGAWERFDMATGTGKTEDEILAKPVKEVEALYCRAATAEELLIKFSFMKQEQRAGKVPPVTVFRDRAGAGFGNREPDEPAEWKAYRARWQMFKNQEIAAGAAHAAESGVRTAEQVRGSVRNFMSIQGLNARDMTREQKRVLGIGRMGDDWKGR